MSKTSFSDFGSPGIGTLLSLQYHGDWPVLSRVLASYGFDQTGSSYASVCCAFIAKGMVIEADDC